MIIKFIDPICYAVVYGNTSIETSLQETRQTNGINKHVIYTYIIGYNRKNYAISAILYDIVEVQFRICKTSFILFLKKYISTFSLSLSLFYLPAASQTWAFATTWRARSVHRSDVRTIASPTSIRVSSTALRSSMCTMRKSQSRIQRLRWVPYA